jgi:PQQ-like domain
VVIAAVAGIAVIGLLTAVSIPSGPSPAAGPAREISRTPAWMYRTGGPVHCNLRLADGRIRSTHATEGVVESSPVVADGTVYVGSDDGNVYALNITGS